MTRQTSPSLPLPNNLHPDAATHRLIGERFTAHAFEPGAPFGTHAKRSHDDD